MTRLSGLFLPVVLVAAGCGMRTEPVTMEEVWAADAPVQETWSAHLVQSSGGVPRLDMTAPYMASFERGDSAYVLLTAGDDSVRARVRTIVYAATGDTSAVVTADRVFWYEDEDRLVAEGNVRVEAENGNRLEAEHLEWHDADRTIRTPGFARIQMEAGRNLLEGYGLVADETLESVSLSNVTGRREVEDT